MRIFDSHAHMGSEQERAIRKQNGIVTMVSVGTPKEARQVRALTESEDWVIPTCGLHPWHAGEHKVEEMKSYLETAPVIGEIGMDSEWCDVPLDVQQEAFEEQLSIASILKKPVVLHTKGQEREIAEIIKGYPNRYLVHWYSSMDHLELYLEQDCYFTLGPDVKQNPAVREVLKHAPLNRLLVETDGWGAVEWALGTKDIYSLPVLLQESIKEIAIEKEISLEIAEKQLEENFYRFLQKNLEN